MDKKTKIAFIIQDMSCGGAQRVLVNLLKGNKFDSFEVHLIILVSLDIFFEIPSHVVIHKLNVPLSNNLFLRFWYVIKKVLFIRKLNKLYAFDRILSFLTTGNIITLLALPKHKNVIISEHNIPLKGVFGSVLNILASYLYQRAKTIVFVSYAVKKEWSKKITILKYEVIYNPVDFNEIDLLSNTESDDRYLEEDYDLAIGRLDYQKGFDMLIKSYSLLKNKNRKLIIIGEGREYKTLSELIINMNLSKQVVILSFTGNPYIWIKKAKTLLMPSRWEGLPLLLIEALFLRKKIIVFDAPGGICEVLDNYRYGIVVQYFNIVEFSRKIEENIPVIYTDDLTLHLKKFSIENITNEYVKILS